MQVKDVMTAPAVSVSPEASLKEVAAILTERRISGLPVVDSSGAVLGVVSEADILLKERGEQPREGFLRSLHRQEERKDEARTAGEAMTSPAQTIHPSASVAEAARRMIEGAVNRLPVVEDGLLVGIVTRADLVRAFVRPDSEIEREIREHVALRWHGIDPNALIVLVRNGEVELRGPVSSPDDAKLVERLVRAIPGVVSVDAHLRVGGAVSEG
jgi:CBS domain-containing protein